MRFNIFRNALAGTRKAILLAGNHADNLTPPRQQIFEFTRVRILNWSRLWTDRRSKSSQNRRVNPIRFRDLPLGFRKVANLTRVHDRHWDRRNGQRSSNGDFEFAGGLDDNELSAMRLHEANEFIDSFRRIAEAPVFAARLNGKVEMVASNVN